MKGDVERKNTTASGKNVLFFPFTLLVLRAKDLRCWLFCFAPVISVYGLCGF